MGALYRKFRPQRFGEVVGQEHIRTALGSALKTDRLTHAYIFSGPRGTGKTSFARLLAKAVNCLNPVDQFEPCNTCLNCQEITQGTALDVVEIDAASNRGIDEIRDLRDKVGYAPTKTKFKVYIIDEVHMLTKEAFNALLKTLEEPPGHVIFILATTELHKVPETILSRCQRYQFHRASPEELVALLTDIAAKEKMKLDSAALELIAERAEGSFRDALTLLGNIATTSTELNVTELRTLLGLPPSTVIESVKTSLEQGKVTELVMILKEFLSTGGDLAILLKALTDRFKNDILAAPTAPPRLSVQLLEQLLLISNRLRFSPDVTATILSQLILLADQQERTPEAIPNTNSARVTDLQKIDKEITPEPAPPAVDAVSSPATEPTAGETNFWPVFLEEVKQHNHALYAVVRSAKLENLATDKVVITVKFRFYSERLFESKNKRLIESLATKVAGRPLSLECLVKTDLDVPGNKDEDLLNTVVDVFELEEAKS